MIKILNGRKLTNKMKKPLNNKSASSLYKYIISMAFFLLIVYFGVYVYASKIHEIVEMQMHMFANGLVDVISENKQITNGEHNYYSQQVDNYKFYMGENYTIYYKIYRYDSATDTMQKTATYNYHGNDAIATPIVLDSKDTIRVEIVSQPDTMLQKVSKSIAGIDGDVYCIGFAEGGVD